MRADNDDELVSKAQSHAKEKHGVDVDRDHILAGARDV
jgi:predicted small metal-binding protein